MFAKLFEVDGKQILIVNTTNDDGDPCVSVSVEPEGLGVCTASVGFKDSDEGYDTRDGLFARIDEEKAVEMAQTMILDFVADLGDQE